MTLPPDAFEPVSREDWRAWLGTHHATEKGVWLVLRKKSAGPVNLSADDAVEETLCFGWIDSKPRRLDEARSMLYIAPRKPGSGWSAVNKARIQQMQAVGRMAPAGQAKIDAAMGDGSWTLLDGVDALEVPPDLQAALAAQEGAQAHWDAFPRSAKRGILEWIAQAKTAPRGKGGCARPPNSRRGASGRTGGGKGHGVLPAWRPPLNRLSI